MEKRNSFNVKLLLDKALEQDLSIEEAVFLYDNADTSLLMLYADKIRQKLHPNNTVSWIIDRNVNITNVCISGCRFCNFFCSINSPRAYITKIEEYRQKITELFTLGGNQLLLQGGLHPDLGLEFYINLFSQLKIEFPTLKLHALSPAEVHFLSQKENINHKETLLSLRNAGLDSLPGAGAEILSERVRKIVSPNKLSGKEWLDVMRSAHSINMLTSATMMFGHIESKKERMEHLISLRELQKEKPLNSSGFKSFIPWPFYSENTELKRSNLVKNDISPYAYIRLLSMSRIILNNIPNIQASWLTVGPKTTSICLHAGANDVGSIMIEENVVSSAGASYKAGAKDLQKLIEKSAFIPRKRNQDFSDYKEVNR